MKYHPSTVTITLIGDARGNVSVRTDMAKAHVGARITPVQSLGLDLLMACQHEGYDIVHGAEHVPALAFAKDVCSPDQFGWAVPHEVVKLAAGIVALSGMTQAA